LITILHSLENLATTGFYTGSTVKFMEDTRGIVLETFITFITFFEFYGL